MIGNVIMEITELEMRAAMEYYLNKSVFNTISDSYHRATVDEVRQQGNGNFVIDFHDTQLKGEIDRPLRHTAVVQEKGEG